MTIRFGLLGAGRIGKVHAKAIHADANAILVAVADAMPLAAQNIADAYACEVRTIDAILAAKDIDAVVICTPTDTHADLIEAFAKAGKAIQKALANRSAPRSYSFIAPKACRKSWSTGNATKLCTTAMSTIKCPLSTTNSRAAMLA